MQRTYLLSVVLAVPLALAVMCVPCDATPSAPSETRIIDNFEQLGIDTPTPRFGWIVNDPARGAKQSAYELVVASTEDGLANGKDVVWRSGQIRSSKQYGVDYAGPALKPTSAYWWQVRTWDGDDQPSPWSKPTRFVTAFFKPEDWAAGVQWIKGPTAVAGTAATPLPVFRKAFHVDKPVKRAYLFISGLGQFVTFINGAKVGHHVMDPAWTDYDRSLTYVTFDITENIRQGDNAIGVMLANGWLGDKLDKLSTRNFGPLRTRVQLHLVYADDTHQDVVSDSTWKVAAGPLLHSEVHGSEEYDARQERPRWAAPGFEDARWAAAEVAEPGPGELVSQNAPPVVVVQTLASPKITSSVPGVLVYDFGQNMSGQFQISVDGPAGATVEIYPGEFVTKGRVNPGRARPSKYTLKGGGPETWGLQFNSTGFRYVEVRQARTADQPGDLPVLSNVTAFFVASAAREVGSFTASDPRYVQIYDMAKRTVLSNTNSIHTDGPNYERLGWQEVVWTILPSSVYCWDEQTLFAKIMRDTRDAQRVSGLCPNIAPCWFHTITDPPGDKYDDSPAWGSSAIIAPWTLYQTYGDPKVLHDQYQTMTLYLAYLKGKEAKGLIQYGLGDWMAPAGNSANNIEGAVYVYDTRLMAEIAAALGKQGDAAMYRQEFERVRAACHKAYFDPKTRAYAPNTQADQAFPLACGIVPDDAIAGVRNALVEVVSQGPAQLPVGGKPGRNGSALANHITAGDIATSAVWHMLGNIGRNDLVQTIIMQPESPSYTAMLNRGETTITENWNLDNVRSHNHDMYAGILGWFYESVGGISALKPGYEEIQVKPVPPPGLKNATVRYDSVRGRIESSWRIDGPKFTLAVTVPANATAVIYMPTHDGNSVREGGVPVAEAKGIRLLRNEGGYAVFSVTSGQFHFESESGEN